MTRLASGRLTTSSHAHEAPGEERRAGCDNSYFRSFIALAERPNLDAYTVTSGCKGFLRSASPKRRNFLEDTLDVSSPLEPSDEVGEWSGIVVAAAATLTSPYQVSSDTRRTMAWCFR